MGRGIGGVLGLALGGVCAAQAPLGPHLLFKMKALFWKSRLMKYYKQSPFYLLADIVKHLENHITSCISHFRL